MKEVKIKADNKQYIIRTRKERAKIMRILFICGNGISSGLIASRTKKAGKAKGIDIETEAYSFTELSEVIDDFDGVLVSPQMKINEDIIKEICLEHNKKYAFIDAMTFSMTDGNKCIEIINDLLKK